MYFIWVKVQNMFKHQDNEILTHEFAAFYYFFLKSLIQSDKSLSRFSTELTAVCPIAVCSVESLISFY